MKTRVAVLGSTGSIGINTLDVISRMPERFQVVALAADSSVDRLTMQSRKFRPRVVSIGTEDNARHVVKSVPKATEVLFGPEALEEIVSRRDVDVVVFAVSGTACVLPLVKSIRSKKRIALANKESIVSAGPAIMKLAKECGVKIVPIDSEHSAIFQCLNGGAKYLDKIYLTSSGGPLLDVPRNKFDSLSVEYILKHPKWDMGRKISVDSATMMNKGLEVIEAQHLFGVNEKDVEVLIHPEAVVHSMVEFSDGSVLAQMGVTDMRIPIQYALTYPERFETGLGRVHFSRLGKLTFRAPDVKKFPCLGLARWAARHGGTAPAVICAADDEVVRNFLDRRIPFSSIPKILEKVLSRHKNNEKEVPSIREVLEAESWAKQEARSLCCH